MFTRQPSCSVVIDNYFGQKPAGLWLTERVWDPAVIPDMAEIGIKNIIVDDYHLIAAGFPRDLMVLLFLQLLHSA